MCFSSGRRRRRRCCCCCFLFLFENSYVFRLKIVVWVVCINKEIPFSVQCFWGGVTFLGGLKEMLVRDLTIIDRQSYSTVGHGYPDQNVLSPNKPLLVNIASFNCNSQNSDEETHQHIILRKYEISYQVSAETQTPNPT